jgi:hypothetical protein
MLRVQRYFPPPTVRSCFSPERLFSPPPLTFSHVFDCENPLSVSFSRRSSSPLIEASSSSEDEGQGRPGEPIPKPSGQISRPRHGYLLRDILQWDDELYSQIQVFSYLFYHFDYINH